MRYRTKAKIKKALKILIPIAIILFVVYPLVNNSGTDNDSSIFSELNDIIQNILSYIGLSDGYSVDVTNIEDDSIEEYSLYGSEQKDIKRLTLVISNNQDESLTLSFKKHGIVYDDGEQIGMHTGGLMASSSDFTKRYLDSMDEEYYGYFTVFPQGKKTFYLAFNNIDMSRNPKLVISFIENPDIDIQDTGALLPSIKKTGYEKEFILDLNNFS
jgi:hypothetical protein